jgi:hypothetical protein
MWTIDRRIGAGAHVVNAILPSPTRTQEQEATMSAANATADFNSYTARFNAKTQNDDAAALDRISVNVKRSAVLDCFIRRHLHYSRFRQVLVYGEDFKMFADAWEQELRLQR